MDHVVPVFFLVTALINAGIGTYVLQHDLRSLANRAFFLFSVGSALWIGGFAVFIITRSFLYIPVLNLGGLMLISGLFWFSQTFPLRTYEGVSLWWYAPFLLGICLCIAPRLLIAGVVFTDISVIPTQGAAFPLYAASLSLYMLLSVYFLYSRCKRTALPDRARFQYFFLGLGLFIVIAVLCDVILPAIGIFTLNFIGPMASVISITVTAYAITRHELFDIRIIIQRGIIYSLLLAGVVGAYIGLLFLISGYFDARIRVAAPLSAAVVLIVGLFTTPSLEGYFRRKTDRFFFKDAYDYSEALQELTDILNTQSMPKPLIEKSKRSLERILRASWVEFVDTTDLPPRGADLRMAVISMRKKFGELLVGPKRSGDRYQLQDERLLHTFAGNFAVALQKAALLAQVKKHSRELETKVSERTRHLQELQEYQRRMTSDISHAFQTPLTVLKGALDELHTNTACGDAGRAADESVERLSRLLYDLLRLSKLESLPAAHHTVFSLSNLVVSTAEYARTVCLEQSIDLTWRVAPDINMNGEKAQLEELLNNLISNAIKYTQRAPRKKIIVTLAELNDEIRLSIIDTGIGIPHEALSHIFERFYRVEGTKEIGTGLGLAICKRIVDLHNGLIEVDTSEGEGSAFTVRFPASERLKNEYVGDTSR